MTQTDEKFMLSAVKLAEKGIGAVEPNPPVGCVIVKSGAEIGKGRHKKFGGPHAEINALEDCRKHDEDPTGATMYVTLEPCSHHGKTPPCVDAIIEAKIARVLIAVPDPSEQAGGGVEILRNAGTDVQTGLCRRRATLPAAPFVKANLTGRPWVILKWAQSIDGKVARIAGDQWISNEKSRKDVHALRRRCQAILVGINTVIADNPRLTPRPARGKNPLRIVLDNNLRMPPDCNLLQSARETPVLILTTQRAVGENPDCARHVTDCGAELLPTPEGRDRSNLHFLIDHLAARNVQQLLVEGGPAVLTSFVEENLVDEIAVYIAPIILAGAGGPGITQPMTRLTTPTILQNTVVKRLGDNAKITGLTEKAVTDLELTAP